MISVDWVNENMWYLWVIVPILMLVTFITLTRKFKSVHLPLATTVNPISIATFCVIAINPAVLLLVIALFTAFFSIWLSFARKGK